MERSRKIFQKIAAASQRVIAAANDYADREDRPTVPRCHYQLEQDMRRIAVACACNIDVLDKPPGQDLTVDVRIQDWLDTDEPQECLQILSQMENILQQDSLSWVSRMFGKGRGSTATRYKIEDAVGLFSSSKGCFHFLFSTEIWNNEKTIREQQYGGHHGDHLVPGESDPPHTRVPALARTGIDISSDCGVPRRGHAEYITLGRQNITAQGLPAGALANAVTTQQKIDHGQDRHAATQRGHEAKSDEQRKEEEKKTEEVLKWLDGLNCAEKQDITLSLRQKDTCKWLFDTIQYTMWKNAENGSLWLRGKPGAGKSVLVSSIIDSFKRARREGEILTFFYCDFRNERSTSSAEAMRSILSQLLRQLRRHSVDVQAVLDDLIEAKEWGGGTLSNAMELAGITSRAASLLSQKPLVIVDALDECKDVQKLIQALMIIRDHVRLFVSSRPLHIIMDALSGVPFVSTEDMADKLSADIELHVTRELDARSRLRDLDSAFKMEIRLILCEKADGMFRWVQCSIDTLDRCITLKEVRHALDNLPTGLDETYERILLAVDMESLTGRLVQRALNWLVAAQRNLRLSEIMEALSINLETRALDSEIRPMHSGALLDACGSLVTYNEKTGIIILAHFSVKEYLVGKATHTKLQAYHINSEEAHVLLARSCMCYISICLEHAQKSPPTDTTISFNTRASSQPWVRLHPKSYPLLDYALDNGLDHFGHLGSEFKSILHDVRVLAKDIQRHSWIWDHVCIPGRWTSQEMSDKPHWPPAVHDLLLYVLVAFAPDSFIKEFFRHRPLRPRNGTNPLVYAAHLNKDEHARTLLSLGAKLSQKGWETVGCRQSLPIEVAFQNRHYTMVALFVEEGSTVPTHIFTDSFFTRSIHWSIPSSIARLLLQTDDFAESMNEYLNVVALGAFESSDHLSILENVAEQDLTSFMSRFTQVADENLAPNLIKEAFLRFAVAQGYLSTAQYFLAHDTPLAPDILVKLQHYPDGWKSASMIRFLVKNGADALARTTSGDSVLHAVLCASNWGPVTTSESEVLEAIKLLVSSNCNPLEADSHGDTPLQIAVERGFTSIARYLLPLGDPLPTDLFVTLSRSWSRRWSHSWPYWCTVPMIRFLIENGVDPLIRATDEVSLLRIILATLYDDNMALEMVKVLVDYGCDPLKASLHGKTPIHIAVEQGHISVVRYLLGIGASLPPSLATSEFHYDAAMIQFLIDNHVDILAKTNNGDSLLHLASKLHKEDEALEVTKLLVSYGCDPFGLNEYGETPLHIAVKGNHTSVAQYLLSLRSDVTFYCRFKMRPRMIRLLVENGVNVLAYSNNLAEPVLHTTLESLYDDDEALEAVQLLVGYGCDLHEPIPGNMTLLHTAIKKGYNSVARYLLILGIHLPSDLLITSEGLGRTVPHTMIPLLVEHGVDVLACSSDGESVLHIMLQTTDDTDMPLEAAKILIDCGCNFLKPNGCGKTPLHIAVERSYISTAQFLISLGASLPLDLLNTLDHATWVNCTARMISFLVKNGVDVLADTSDGGSLLHIALDGLYKYSEDDVLEAMKILVDHGCDPSKANARGKTPLHIAVERGCISIAQNLISLGASLPPDILLTISKRLQWNKCRARMIPFLDENGANLLAHDSDGNSALHVLLKFINYDDEALEAVRILVAYRCDPFETNTHGQSPLHIAVERGHIAISQCFVSLGASLPPDLLVTLDRGRSRWATMPMVHLLVEKGVNIFVHTGDGDSVLHMAVRCSNNNDSILEVVKLLISLGCDPTEANSHGNTPLHIAAARNKICVAHYLLALGEPLPPDLLSTLSLGQSHRCTTAMIHFLVRNGVNILARTSDGDSALHNALRCLYIDLGAVELLVDYGCNPLEANSRGEVPLHVAATRGHISVARYLITQGASVLTKASNGDTVLHFATSSVYPYPYDDEDADDCTLAASRFFVGRGSDPTIPNDNGVTPFHNAVDLGRVKTINYFLSLKTPLPHDILFTAIRSDKNSICCRYIVKVLITSGCDTQSTNSEGDTPLQAAIKKGKIDVVKYLLSVESMQKAPVEDLLSAAALAPASVQSEMRRVLSDSRRAPSSLPSSGSSIQVHES